MKPTVKERQQQQAAKNLVYIYGALGQTVPADVAHASADIYGGTDGEENMKTLCIILRLMTDEQRNRIVYDGRTPDARRLADWWDEHKAEDDKALALAAKEQRSFTACFELVRALDKDGYTNLEIAERVAEIIEAYVDEGDSTHVLEFEDGVIILSSMDGIFAYKGKRV